jgi:hypothetical protein
MTITLADARARVRLRLEDTSEAPGWSDADIDAGFRQALDEYSYRFPEQQTVAVPVSAGATAIDLPDRSAEVRRVVDPRGTVVPPRGQPVRAVSADEQSWEVWAGRVEFARALMAGNYSLWVTTPRTLPESDGEPLPVSDDDISLIVIGAALWCLEQRSVAEWKRGPLPARYETVLRRARDEYQSAWRARLRRVRTGRLLGTG